MGTKKQEQKPRNAENTQVEKKVYLCVSYSKKPVEKTYTAHAERNISCDRPYLLQDALVLWSRDASGRDWSQSTFGGERVPQALPHTVRVSVITVVAKRATVEAIQTTPALQGTHLMQQSVQTSTYTPQDWLVISSQSPVLLHKRRSTHRRVRATEPGAFWVPAAGGAIGTVGVAVTIDDWTPLLVRDVVVFGLLKGRCSSDGRAWFLCSLLPHHGYVHPRLVLFLAHLGGQVTRKPGRTAVGQVWAAHSLRAHGYARRQI